MNKWTVLEETGAMKRLARAPKQVREKYDFWKNVLLDSGPHELCHRPGFRDKALSGKWYGYRASRLSLQWRVIYRVEQSIVTVIVEEITPHQY